MSLVVFQHVTIETPSRLGNVLRDHGHELRVINFEQGDTVPVDLDNVDGLVIMGGPQNVDEVDQHAWMQPEMDFIKRAHDAGLPIVGVCLGAQLIAKSLGGDVAPMDMPEVGWQNVKLAFPGTIDPIYIGITWDSMQFHLHGQQVTELPPGATPLAGSKACRTQAFKVGFRTYAFQYHFEWNEQDIRQFVKDELVTRAGANPDEITRGLEDHYDTYARRGERLCNNIASLLMPLDKRKTA